MITITIFSVVAIMSTVGLMNTMQSTKRIQSQVFLYTEAQALMDQLARAVERNTIDYEAYYDREVQGNDGWGTETYGYYAQAFYDPGTGGPDTDGPYTSVGDYGAYCSGSLVYPDDCDSPDFSQLDLDTGQHPFDGYSGSEAAEDMNAFCDESRDGTANCEEVEHYVVKELILINGAGDERLVFAQEAFDSSEADYHISKVLLTGTDTDSDGVVDEWVCASDYPCAGDTPDEADLTDGDGAADAELMPITPSAVDVEEFYIYIAPTEDPYRAFAEEEAQVQPQATIVLTVSLSDDYSGGILGEPMSITIQRTVSTGVYSEISSYE